MGRSFGDDALAYFEERLDIEVIRGALYGCLRRAKRNKAFDGSRHIGLAIDGSGICRCSEPTCSLCLPIIDAEKKVIGYRHYLCAASLVGVGLTLPVDVEAMKPGEGESIASRRLFERVIDGFGVRFFDYIVADGAYASAPFLHVVRSRRLRAVIRLKENVPTLFEQARKRFEDTPAHRVERIGGDRVEIWDGDDFDPWEGLDWETVRVLRYRQHRPDGSICEAYWLTDWPRAKADGIGLFEMAKSRWEIENQIFNDGKNRYGLETLRHHQANSLIVSWLLCFLTMTLERLFRIRHIHRGSHAPLSAIELLRLFCLDLGRRRPRASPG